jgi:hypothetical protein
MWPLAHIQWRPCGAIGIGDTAQKNSPKIFPKPQNEKNGGIRG